MVTCEGKPKKTGLHNLAEPWKEQLCKQKQFRQIKVYTKPTETIGFLVLNTNKLVMVKYASSLKKCYMIWF